MLLLEKMSAQIGRQYEDDYMRIPVIKSKIKAFSDFFYNPSEKTVFGKTKKQWGNYEILTVIFKF